MKTRKTILLMLLVVAVWGTIGYKVYQSMEDDDFPLIPTMKKQVIFAADSKEDYPLTLSYQDPFLKKYAKKQFSVASQKPRTRIIKPLITVPNIIIQWDKIEYLGSIYNTSKKSTVATLRIDGVDLNGRQGDIVNDFTIMSISKDSIQLLFGNQTKYITKKK